MELYQEFIHKIEKFIPLVNLQSEGDKENLLKLIENPQFKELLASCPSIVGIYNNLTMGYDFMSNNTKEIMGYEKELFLGAGGMEKVLSTFKTEHAQLYNQYIFPVIFEYFHKCTATKDISNHRFTASFKLKKADGSYKWCMQQIKAISMNENMYPVLVMVFISDITDIKKDEDIDFVIAYKDEHDIFQNIYALTIPAGGSAISFSKRELDILTCIKKGLPNKEIADMLTISEHTVKSHRKNILKKSNGLNMIEIIQLMNNKNILPVASS